MDKTEAKQLWNLLHRCLEFHFVFASFQDGEVSEFYHYALDKMSDTKMQLIGEFREKFAAVASNE